MTSTSSTSESRSDDRARALAQSALDGARVGVYTILGGATGLVPLPWVPEALVRRVRGAVLEDLCGRAGITVSKAAREELTRPGGSLPAPRGAVGQAAGFLTKKVLGRFLRFGPLALYAPFRSGLETYVFARLFGRYLGERRFGTTPPSPRLEREEAERVRKAVDAALAKALTVGRVPGEGLPAPRPDDERDAVTATIDRLLMGVAAAPAWLLAHVDVAFDEMLATGAPAEGASASR